MEKTSCYLVQKITYIDESYYRSEPIKVFVGHRAKERAEAFRNDFQKNNTGLGEYCRYVFEVVSVEAELSDKPVTKGKCANLTCTKCAIQGQLFCEKDMVNQRSLLDKGAKT